jgi:hypothetical protein
MTASYYTTGLGQQLATHHIVTCKFRWCVVHSPMPGPWDQWPTYWDHQRRLMMRQCPCGARHPAAEEYMLHGAGALIHPCCKRCPCVPNLNDIQSAKQTPGTIDGEAWETTPILEIES